MTGWDEDFLQSAVDECTNLSGLIGDCALFNIQSEDTQRQCTIETMPALLKIENVLGGIADALTALPGNVAIQYGPEAATVGAGAATAASVATTAPSTYSVPSLTYAAGSSTPGAVFFQSTSTTDGAASILDVPTSSSFSSASIPATTPAPTTAPDTSVQYEVVSTEYNTVGGLVHEVIYEEAVVYVTQDVVTTVTVSPSVKSEYKRQQRGHLLRHRHLAGHR